MSSERCDPDYLPWLIAREFNFLPDPEAMFELLALGGDEYSIRLASFNVSSNIIVNYDQEWNNP